MKQRSMVAALLAPLVLFLAVPVFAQADDLGTPMIIGLNASAEDGRTIIRVETTTPSVSYISYSRDATTYVIDIYGLEVGDVAPTVDVSSPEVRSVRFEPTGDRPGDALARLVIERASDGPTMIQVEGTTLVAIARQASAQPALRAAPRARSKATWSNTAVQTGLDSQPATRITAIRTERTVQGLTVSIQGNGRLRYESFLLDDPPRLVLDLPGVDNNVSRRAIQVDHSAVDRIRVAQFRTAPERVARVVLDLGSPEDYRIVGDGDSLRIVFGGDVLDQTMSSAAVDLTPRAYETAQGVPTAPPAPESAATNAFETRVFGSEDYYDGDDEEGTLISLDLKDADVKDVLRYFSEISGLNIILDPAVGGTVTVRLIEVPWNKALDIILKAHGYGKTLDGNVLRIADVAKLTQEEAMAAELQKSQEEARPLVTITRPISYGDAAQIATIIQSTSLSSKGQIIIDARTNTLVITEVDIPSYRERILNLIRTLDTPTPQVEIEARIVETTKTWARSFGIQWGFNQTFDQTTGSTTDLTFPASGVISGDLVQSTGGFLSTLPGSGYAVNLPSAGANAAIGFHLANITDQLQLDVVLSALEDEGKARVLSAPKITTQSNIPASIKSGANIPIQTVANNTITVQYIAADLQLNVTPQVTAEGTIILQVTVNQSTPDLGTAVGVTALPPITTRQAQTTLMVPDGGTAVIGGVFQINESEAQNRLPWISRIPVVGWLFKNQTQRRTNNELLIFITPKIKTLV